jgi:signal transduction histidine kinase/CheY-like chemotaxis protein
MIELHVVEERILILSPTGRDASLTAALLTKAALTPEICANLSQLYAEIDRGAAAVLLAEEVLTFSASRRLVEMLEAQPPWSDLPIIVFMGSSSDVVAHARTVDGLRALGNVTLLDRPLRPITMLSAARAALRARRRQYQARDELVRRESEVQKRDQFLAMLSHELRNPLSSIVLAADTLEDGSPEQARRVEIIQRQGKHLTHLIDDLLDVARVTIGKVALREADVELNELTERVLRFLEQTAAAAQVEVSMHRAPAQLAVRGDAVRLEQVLGNIVANAIKYTPSGGHVDVSLEADEQHARIRVRDDGVGIAPDVLPHVFDLFAQADHSLDRARGGLGIGLTVARSLVELHSGRIDVQSAGVGQGSEFVITLPRSEGTVPIATESQAPTIAPPARHRVLVVEDNEDSRELMHMVLESYGHEVSVAGDGAEGVRCAQQMRPNVALVDLGLPGLNGFEVARHLRADLGDEIVLIALSGYGRSEDRRESKRAGFDLHYLKPVDSNRLRRLLASGPEELARRRQSGELATEESEL